MAGRLPVRLLGRQLQRQSRRPFSSSSHTLDAHNFYMPAMSPTMTEGGIASWKVKPGDSFAPGDVLVEIETDKATMDVEAQEAGIMVKIFSEDGSKAVQVGQRIAVLGDEGDSVDSLEIPADDSQPISSPAENIKVAESSAPPTPSGASPPTKGTPENKRPSSDRPTSSPTGPGQNTKYPMYPSVIALIHENHISDADVAKIPATGPQSRLLKGDVLAYLGTITADYSATQSKRIEKMGHMDLSNIKIIPAAKPAASKAADAPATSTETSIRLPISLAEVLKTQKRLQDALGVSLPLSTFLARAVDFANDDLPLPAGHAPSADDLFNAVVGLDKINTSATSRGTYLPAIEPLAFPPAPRAMPKKRKEADIIDILTGRAGPASRLRGLPPARTIAASPSAGGAMNVFSVTVPMGEEKRARTFLERMKTVLQVEPGKLVL